MEKKSVKLYNVVYSDIVAKIRSGEWKVGEKLPTELELTKIYGVSRITITRAMKDLTEANLVYRVKGSGTFVNGKLNRSTPLVIPTILPFEETYNDIMKGIQSSALQHNVFTPFYNSKNNIDHERQYLWEVLKNRQDGLIVYPCASLENLDLYAEILAKDIPIVCIDRPIEGLDTPLVTTTNADCMRRIVKRLAADGHRRIGFFSVDEHMAVTERERFKGFCRGLIEAKLPIVKDYIFNTSDMHKREMISTPEQQQLISRKFVKREMTKYLSLEEKPTAICCLNDSTLDMVCQVSKQLGIHIPEELTVTGFDCTDMEKTRRLGYLCARQDFYRLGSAAVTLMLQILNGEPYAAQVLVEGILIN